MATFKRSLTPEEHDQFIKATDDVIDRLHQALDAARLETVHKGLEHLRESQKSIAASSRLSARALDELGVTAAHDALVRQYLDEVK